ncbi:hypothetical protein BCR39DRAFT_557247 [Naematelia encephala]|uniref:Uncharacterized protein n=1 Tax=Naematelia encephala TaxID=71784 RepID=A0A1Y2BEC7_9TREE|nr:hypothetical protein BCR39DRAFT_557247 [Naematelia encephala]
MSRPRQAEGPTSPSSTSPTTSTMSSPASPSTTSSPSGQSPNLPTQPGGEASSAASTPSLQSYDSCESGTSPAAPSILSSVGLGLPPTFPPGGSVDSLSPPNDVDSYSSAGDPNPVPPDDGRIARIYGWGRPVTLGSIPDFSRTETTNRSVQRQRASSSARGPDNDVFNTGLGELDEYDNQRRARARAAQSGAVTPTPSQRTEVD